MTTIERRELPFATALALTRSAKYVSKDQMPHLMQRVFDRPTRWTLRSTRFEKATKHNLVASVVLKDWVGGGALGKHYLDVQIFGGRRRQKRFEARLLPLITAYTGLTFEILVPASGIRLNANGNVTAGVIQRVLSDLKMAGQFGQNRSNVSIKRNKRYRRERYFIGGPRNRLHPGVWVRRGKNIRPVFLAVTKAQYRKRFPFFLMGERFVLKRFPKEFAAAMRQAVDGAR